jgi:ethanolamine ammonia-lyase small subunit
MADPPDRARDAFLSLRSATTARIGLGRAGQGLPTEPMLAFQLAHARAQDAVHAALDVDRLRSEIDRPTVVVETAAPDRRTYLRSPDLGRRLGAHDLARFKGRYDLALVIADGLSATAVHAHAPALIKALVAQLPDWTLAPVIIARQARVAIGDPIAEALGARMVVVIIGERPGLSAVDSLSAYITFDPRSGRRDSERNCVSNIRTPDGLLPIRAAETIVWLLAEARRLGFTGVALKDRQTSPLNDGAITTSPSLSDQPLIR